MLRSTQPYSPFYSASEAKHYSLAFPLFPVTINTM